MEKKIEISDLSENDVYFEMRQKGVDIKIGTDITSMALKRAVDKIILVPGDSDLVPAAKQASIFRLMPLMSRSYWLSVSRPSLPRLPLATYRMNSSFLSSRSGPYSSAPGTSNSAFNIPTGLERTSCYPRRTIPKGWVYVLPRLLSITALTKVAESGTSSICNVDPV